MNIVRAQQALEALQGQCPRTDQREIAAWISAITRAREALSELEAAEDKATTAIQGPAVAGSEPGPCHE